MRIQKFGLTASMLLAGLITVLTFVTTTTTLAQGSLTPIMTYAPNGVLSSQVRISLNNWLRDGASPSSIPVGVTMIPNGSTLDLSGFGNLDGQTLFVGFSITSLNLFSLSSIRLIENGPWGNTNATLGQMNQNFSTIQGWGQNTKTGEEYFTGNPTTPVTRVVGLFPSHPLSSVRSSGTETLQYLVAGMSGSTSFNIMAVPEPSTIALFGLGGLLGYKLFRRKRILR